MNRQLWLYSSTLFWGLALVAAIQLGRLWHYDPRRNTKTSVAKQLHFGVFIAAITRATVTVLRNATDADRCDNVQTSLVTVAPVAPTPTPTRMNSFFASDLSESMLLDFVYGMFPTLTFFNVTSLILLFWAQRYWETKMPVLYEERDIGPFLNRTWLALNIALWAIAFILAPVLVLRDVTCQQERQIESSFVAVLSAISSVSYCIYGRRLLRQMGRIKISSELKDKRIRQISYLGGVYAFCFALRAPSILIQSFLIKQELLRSWYVDLYLIIYLFVVEFVPSTFTLYMMREVPATRYNASANFAARTDASPYADTVEETLTSPLFAGRGPAEQVPFFLGSPEPTAKRSNPGMSLQGMVGVGVHIESTATDDNAMEDR